MVGLLEAESCGYSLRRSWATDALAHLSDIWDWDVDERVRESVYAEARLREWQ